MQIEIELNPHDLDTIRQLLKYERDRYMSDDLRPPNWVNTALPKFVDDMEEQDNEHSKKGEMLEAVYRFAPKQTEALAYIMFMWLKHMYENRRKFVNTNAKDAVRDVFVVAEKFAETYEHTYEHVWEERY